VVLLTQDNYYKDRSHLPPAERRKCNFDHPDALEFPLLKEHLIALKAGHNINCPIYNFPLNIREKAGTAIAPANLIIVEGILIFTDPDIRNLCDLKIFVEAEDDIRLLRRLERDLNERAIGFAEARDQYLKNVKPMHDFFVATSRVHADLIVPSESHNAIAVDVVRAYVQEHLRTAVRNTEKAARP
jgi:uridine kinase